MSLSDLFKSSRHQHATKDNASAGQVLRADAENGGILSRSQSFGGLFASSPRHNLPSGESSNWPTLTESQLNTVVGSQSSGNLSGYSDKMKKAGSTTSTNTLSRGQSVLGQNNSPNTTKKLLQGLSATWGGKAPPTPRPQRSVTIFRAIEKGLTDCMHQTQKDINNLKSTVDSLSINSNQSQGKVYELEKQLKNAERYFKRLECQAVKLEELAEQYDVEQRMHEGVRTMGHAYVLGPGKDRESALHSIRHGMQECVDTLVAIETELERMMGTLMFQIKGIQGFARLVAGDVFEINVRYGDQKWKTRGRVLKNEKQSWDNPRAIFKALLGEHIVIKAMEVKTLGKNVLLGHKYCETLDLFCAAPQLMSVNLNPSGSLKLHLIVTWNPLHFNSDELVSPKSLPPLLAAFQSPVNKRRGQVPVPEAEISNFPISPSGSSSKSGDICSSSETPSPITSLRNSSSQNNLSLPDQLSDIPTNNTLFYDEKLKSSGRSGEDNSECCSLDHDMSYQGTELQDLVHSLLSSMEDIQGQYPELHLLELHLNHLDKILRWSKGGSSRRGSTGSEISISIESALGCFDFLNTAIEGDESEVSNECVFPESNRCLDKDIVMTAKTTDSGVASIARQLSDKEIIGRQLALSSPSHGPTTGYKQLDQALSAHLSYCQKLIDNLGSFGPLKCREIYSLDKLRRQASIVGTFLALLNDHDLSSNFTKSNEPKKTIHGASMLPDGSESRKLWIKLTQSGSQLCLVAESLLEPLEELIKPYLTDGLSSITALSVSKLLLCRIIDLERFDPEAFVTNLQFQLYLSQGNASFKNNVEILILEASLIEALHSPDPVVVKKALSSMQNSLPPSECLHTVGHMLLYGDEPSLSIAAEQYIEEILKNIQLRKQVLTVFLEGLEYENPLTRQGACMVLAMAKATEYIEQLVFVCYADDSGKVRQQAKETLFSFGSEGQLAYEQAQLFTHGFQGLSVH